jgi:hypothetical protein
VRQVEFDVRALDERLPVRVSAEPEREWVALQVVRENQSQRSVREEEALSVLSPVKARGALTLIVGGAREAMRSMSGLRIGIGCPDVHHVWFEVLDQFLYRDDSATMRRPAPR